MKLFETALIEVNKRIIQKRAFHTSTEMKPPKAIYAEKIVEERYKMMPVIGFCCLQSTVRSFLIS